MLLQRLPSHLVARTTRIRNNKPTLAYRKLSPTTTRCFHASCLLLAQKQLQKFNLADIGEGITECEIIRWSAQASSKISAFDPLCEVQSDKASVEITSPFDGVLKEILVKEGEIAKVGEGLCLIEVDAEEAEAVDSEDVEDVSGGKETPTTTPTTSVSISTSTPTSAGSSTHPQETRRKHPLDPTYVPPPSTPSPTSSSASKRTKVSDVDVLAPPSVRFLARQHGVDIRDVAPGSGKGGRVEKKDVLDFVNRKDSGSETSSAAEGGFGGVGQGFGLTGGEDTIVELGRTRYGMWKAMEKSLQVPHFSYSTSLDITELHALLPTLNAHIPPEYLPDPSSSSSSSSSLALQSRSSKPQLVNPSAVFGDHHPNASPSTSLESPIPSEARYTKLTYLPFLIKTLSKAMLEWPIMRATIFSSSSSSSSSGGKPTLSIRPHADIALALSTPTGLYSPVLQSVERHSVYSLTSRIARLASLGRRVPSGLKQEDFNGTSGPTPLREREREGQGEGGGGMTTMTRKGATLTVSNIGAIGKGESAHPVLVPGGGVAIVAIGRAKWVWDAEVNGVDSAGTGAGAGSFSPRRRLVLPISFSADHRVVEGAELAAFVECWREWVERPGRLVGWGV